MKRGPHMLTRSIGALVALVASAALVLAIYMGQLRSPHGDFEVRPLAPSAPAETTLRALRIAGIEHASVGLWREATLVRVAVPAIDTSADIEIAMQAAVAAVAAGFPDSETYMVQLFQVDQPLLQVEWSGADVRSAISADDASALRRAANFTFLTASAEAPTEQELTAAQELQAVVLEPEGSARFAILLRETRPQNGPGFFGPVTSVSVEAPGHYLDEKNRMFGVLDDESPARENIAALANEVESMRRAAPGIPAMQPGGEAGRVWTQRASETLRRLAATPSVGAIAVREVRAELSDAPSPQGAGQVERVRGIALAAMALEGEGLGTLLRPAHELALYIRESRPAQDSDLPVLRQMVPAANGELPAREITDLKRTQELDFELAGPAGRGSAVHKVVSAAGKDGISYAHDGALETLAPQRWLAYSHSDGKIYWLAGEEGDAALVDGSLHGWGWVKQRAYVVDARHLGRVIAHVPVR